MWVCSRGTGVGEYGCGKTTLLNILQKFYTPENGRITLNSFPFEHIPAPDWRKIIGVVPQEITLFNGSLLENICLNQDEKDIQKTFSFCQQNGFDKFFNSFPQSYATVLGEHGVNLSGGQKQLVGLARALYKKPQILLLDEPTSAMDRSTEEFVINLICNLTSRPAIFIISHRLSLVKLADKVYVMEQGIIIDRTYTDLSETNVVDPLYSGKSEG